MDESQLPQPRQARDAVGARLQHDAEQARAFAQLARSANTKRAYRADWADFCSWCDERGVPAAPASTETVALYVASRATDGPNGADGAPAPGLRVSTLERRLSAINQAHRSLGLDPPASRRLEPLHSVWAGIVRSKGVARDKVAPALPEDLRAMVQAPGSESVIGERLSTPPLRDLRDRSMLLLGFAGALRRSELAAILVPHVQTTAEGLRLYIPTSKSDQEGRGAVLGIHYGRDPQTCPVRALRSWIRAASDHLGAPLVGPVFRKIDRWGKLWDSALTPGAVAQIVKRSAARAGLDPTVFAGHSLRAGFATQAARQGHHERVIMRHTRHKSERVLREYIREGALFDENPTDGIGL